MLINQQKWQKLPEAACILNVVAQNILLLFVSSNFYLVFPKILVAIISRFCLHFIVSERQYCSLNLNIFFPNYYCLSFSFSLYFSSLFLPLPEKYTCIQLYIIKLYSFSQISHTHFNYSILFFRHLRILHFGILRNWEWALIINEHIKFQHSSVFFNHVLLSRETSPDEVPF